MKLTYLISTCLGSFIFLAAAGASAAGDAVEGKKLAKKCVVCHTLEKDGKNRLGPNLFNIIDTPAASNKDYAYSSAMRQSGITWDPATFTDFVAKPKKVVKGTKMSFTGLKTAAQRADLLAYFQTLRSSTEEIENHGNAEDGKEVARKHCIVCHSFEKGGKTVFGPNLFDIAGKPAAAIAGYDYSDALKNANLSWTDKNLIGFLADPEQFVKGTKARFPGLKSAQDKADILAYLKTLK